MMLQCTIAGQSAQPEVPMTLIAKSVARSLSVSAIRISRALNRSAVGRYEEARAQVERTGFGGML
ncbi:hypothetical protein ACFQE0_22625 [Methylobacterium komagatae]|uniref:Uncharacterized protein n=1 Tax=Methylobacterium komagatae TaxID=374425 RepID=A0ABW2BQ43_9HYPH